MADSYLGGWSASCELLRHRGELRNGGRVLGDTHHVVNDGVELVVFQRCPRLRPRATAVTEDVRV